MSRNPIETVLGAVVLVVAVMFVALAYSSAQVATTQGYEVQATFLKVGGLQVGSDVRISGINIGTVTRQSLDQNTYEAKVTMVIDPQVSLPDDTVAAIVEDGLLGGKYVDLQPGRSPQRIGGGGTITNSQDFRSLEDLVGEIIFLATGGDS
ncbi:MAG: outer membrane lipid asymmetry maintenance protein MlaD [Rhodospirillaceae bacterium]|jgi:phospholipid/cholesterol/gamma-HCH transport system substrate-binding protein|nr:outer membrane lipid asymmetry maintenance protein MlaD [Rhodospirillaceae bacterium]